MNEERGKMVRTLNRKSYGLAGEKVDHGGFSWKQIGGGGILE